MTVTSLKVDKKLLKVNETGYTDKWSKDTYSYFHMFDRNVLLAVPREGIQGASDLSKWKQKAIELTYDIKNKGLIAGRTEMVRIVNEEYGLTVPGRNTFDNKCKDLDDIYCIVGNKEWYYQNIEYSRNVIYHLLYLISRSGYNSWLINAEKEWMKDHGILYETGQLDSQHKSNVKGFVNVIMQSMFSNTIQKAFRKKMLFLYGEFITVRNRKASTDLNKFKFSPHVFKSTYKGYIVTPTKTTPSVKTLPDIFRTGKQWIQDCRSLNLDVDEIQDLVVSFYANKKVIQKTHKIKHVAADLLTNDFNMIVENDINNNISTGKIYFIEFFDYINLI